MPLTDPSCRQQAALATATHKLPAPDAVPAHCTGALLGLQVRYLDLWLATTPVDALSK